MALQLLQNLHADLHLVSGFPHELAHWIQRNARAAAQPVHRTQSARRVEVVVRLGVRFHPLFAKQLLLRPVCFCARLRLRVVRHRLVVVR